MTLPAAESSGALVKNTDSWHPCLVPDLSGNAWFFILECDVSDYLQWP